MMGNIAPVSIHVPGRGFTCHVYEGMLGLFQWKYFSGKGVGV